MDAQDKEFISDRLARQAGRDELKLTIHAHEEMVQENISYELVREALLNCSVIEMYPDHRRGHCCLVCGQISSGRHLHVVCTISCEVAVIITVYEPRLPKWISPFQRGRS